MPAGYSGTPLSKKLGIKTGHRVGTFDAPAHFPELIDPLPDDVLVEAEPDSDLELDVAIVFVTDEGELRARFPDLSRRLRPNGGLWVSWPKKSSPLATDLGSSVLFQQLSTPGRSLIHRMQLLTDKSRL